MVKPFYLTALQYLGAKGDCDFRISDLVKIQMELIFNPCGEFRWSPEGPVSQIHYPHLQVGVPELFPDLFQACSDAKERVVSGK